MNIKGYGAIVTGGSSGLGRATAKKLAAGGARVSILDVNITEANKVAAEIGGAAFECDVSDEKSAMTAVENARNIHGPARIVVNCAGIVMGERVCGKDGPHALRSFNKVIGVNLVGSFNLIRLTAGEMTKLEEVNDTGERGVIINTASVAAYEGQIGQAAYAASKGGIVSMTLPIARELAKFGVRVVTIAPGLMETPMLGQMPPQVKESLIASTLFPKRLGLPEEYADLALHICENPMINGETIRLDGGVRLAVK